MLTVKDIRNKLVEKYKNGEFVVDKTGKRLVEVIAESFEVDEPVILGKPSQSYRMLELDWYLSQSLNVYDIPKTPAIWRAVSDKNGNINSNYGWAIFSKENYEQYKNCIRQLRAQKESRRAQMIYTRPSMQVDYNKNGMSDYICTNVVQVLLRGDTMYYIVNMRSNDVVFGFNNDYFWHEYVAKNIFLELQPDYKELQHKKIIWNAHSLHVYDTHFDLLDNYIKTGDLYIKKGEK